MWAKLKILRTFFFKDAKKSHNNSWEKLYNVITHNSEKRSDLWEYTYLPFLFLSLDRKTSSIDMRPETSTHVRGQFINKTFTAECCIWPIIREYSRVPHNKLLLLVGIFTSDSPVEHLSIIKLCIFMSSFVNLISLQLPVVLSAWYFSIFKWVPAGIFSRTPCGDTWV